MKKVLLILTIFSLVGIMCACTQQTTTVDVSQKTNIEETTKSYEIEKQAKEVVNNKTEREFAFNPNVKFVYTEDDDYMKAIIDDMVVLAEDIFGDQGAVEIPTPYIVKKIVDDKSDIKVYGDFWIYGYEMYGTIFNTKNGGSNPGCYHLKDEDGKITVVNKVFAEAGTDSWSSLVEICDGDENLAKEILNARANDSDKLRLDYAKMYAKENKLKFSGIKDYGWPVILLGDISDAEFLYNFYSAYFYEIRQDDVLNDMIERIENLKKKYMTSELIEKMDEKSADLGADAIINAQDVTELMLDTLEVTDDGNGNLAVTFDTGAGELTKVNVKIIEKNGQKVIVDMNY